MHSNYKHPALRKLRDELLAGCRQSIPQELVDRVESALWDLAGRTSVSYRQTYRLLVDRRPPGSRDMEIPADVACHDLQLVLDDLTDAARTPVEAVGERVLTIDELCQRFNVSAKTVSRWRRYGLVSRRFVFNGVKRVGFLESTVERFARENCERIERGARFSQLSQEEIDLILRRARRLAQAGACPGEVARRLSAKLGRSPETIRYTIKQHDREHPEAAIYPDHAGPMRLETKRRIYQRYRRGESVAVLSRKFCRGRKTIEKVIDEMRAKRILALPLDFIPNEHFELVTVKEEKEYLGPMPPSDQPLRKIRLPAGLPAYLARMYEVPLLTREQEAHLFRKMNYLKYKASRLRAQLDPARPRRRLMDRIERLYEMAVGVKNELIRANLRLVVSIAKRHVDASANFFELVSDGNMSLIRAVEKFDFARGNKFSTYATWAIEKNFARTIPVEYRRRERFSTSFEEIFDSAEDSRADPFREENAQNERESQIHRILQYLDEREQQIIVRHYGLDRQREPLTLKEIGREMGVSKERVRQIEARAMDKLRQAAHKERVELLSMR